MKIVFLVHYFPPLNSTGSRRVLAFSKYLTRLGHSVHVISTVKTVRDGSLSESVPDTCELIELSFLQQKVQTSRDILAEKPMGGRSWLGQKLAQFKRGFMNYFGQLLDHRLFFTLHFLNPFLNQRAKKALQEADVIISSCPPWPMHLAGHICKKRFKKKWVADYRDQFSGNHFYPGNRLTRFLENWVERRLLSSADSVLVISQPMQAYYFTFHANVFCITNGYDEDLFTKVNHALHLSEERSKKKVIRYLGTLTTHRIPTVFLQALSSLAAKTRDEIRVEFYGEHTSAATLILERFPTLSQNLCFRGLVPYEQAIALMKDADALLLPEMSVANPLYQHSIEGTMTTKLFEYLAARKPIIAEVEPASLIATVIEDSGLSCVCTLETAKMREALNEWLQKNYVFHPNEEVIYSYSREAKTNELVCVLEGLL